MIQLIAAVAIMYLVVTTAGYWAVKKQRLLRASEAEHEQASRRGERHG